MNKRPAVVLAAVDESERAREVLRVAKREAEMRNAELHVVNVFQIPWIVLGDPGGTSGATVLAMDNAETAYHQMIGNLVTEEVGSAVIADLRGYPPKRIVDYAAEVEAELIVVGNRGAGAVKSLVLGSTSHGVIHDAHCDVLVVKTSGES